MTDTDPIIRRTQILIMATILCVAIGGTSSAAGTEGTEDEPSAIAEMSYVPGQVIVKLRDGQREGLGIAAPKSEAILYRLRAAYGLNKDAPKKIRPAGKEDGPAVPGQCDVPGWHLLGTEEDVLATCARLREDAEVAYAQPNYIYRPCRTPNDPEFPDQYAHQLIQMEDAWDISTGSRDVVVAVLGTGVDVNHPDLKDNAWVNEGEIPDNEIDDDENGYVDDVHGWNVESSNGDVIPEPDWWDIGGHETMVAGVIAGVGDNDEGVCGVNWQCSVMAIRMSIYITSAEVAAGLDYAAANGADILNMSFGSDDFGPEGDPIVQEAINKAFAAGVLLVASAGNDDTDQINYPAGYYNVMAVASTDGEDIKTGHSSFGPWVDITAPGTDIVTTDLDSEYIATAGTSFSAPYVAAVGALVLSHRPELSHVEVRAILENTTDPVYYGLVDPEVGYIGTGRVNAYTALVDADARQPLGEIAAPRQGQTFAADVNSIDATLFVHGDSYRLEYSPYGGDNWNLISEGDAVVDANGLIHLTFPNPGISTYDLRLSVSAAGRTHLDRKVFGIDLGTSQAHWPKPAEVEEMPEEQFYGSPICMDVDGDGRNEIVQSSLSFEDFWEVPQLNVWREDGTALEGWPVKLELAWDPPICAVGDIDGDGDYEIVGTCNYDALVYAWHVESGELVDGDWPVVLGDWIGSIVEGPVLADLDGDGDSEVIVALDWQSDESDGLYAIQGDGSSLWQRRYTAEGPMSVADFDDDGDVEIALSGYGPGISTVYTYILGDEGQLVKKWRGGSHRGTLVADLDSNGDMELVFSTDEEVQVVRVDGSTVWKKRIGEPFGARGTLSVGDMNNDGHSEIFVTSYVEEDGFTFTLIHGLDDEGNLLDDLGFPKTVMGYPGGSAPLIGDVDGDGDQDLLVGVAGTPVIAWDADGSTTAGFPTLELWTEIDCGATLNDLDLDGDIELLVGGWDYRFHVMDLPGAYVEGNMDWGVLRHDPQNSGWMSVAPTLDPISAPDAVRPGEKVQFELHASNPANRPLRFVVGNLPEGASFDEETLEVSWKPTADQVFHTYRFSFMVTDGIRQTSRSASITVAPEAIYHANMDTDPGWQLDAGWAWGVPAGDGSWNGDPSAGYTGENVVGYALDGDYGNDLGETVYATTGAIDCQQYANIRLSFRRWLGVEAPYDYANVQVSNDGESWVDLWATGSAHISDGSWQFVEYAVPAAVADGQGTVYFRWGIGPTDESVTYPGWNIDDVQVTGDPID